MKVELGTISFPSGTVTITVDPNDKEDPAHTAFVIKVRPGFWVPAVHFTEDGALHFELARKNNQHKE